MRRVNRRVLILTSILTLMAGFLLSSEIEGWKLPAIMFIIFAAVYGTAKKNY